jgi:hypothetical protein
VEPLPAALSREVFRDERFLPLGRQRGVLLRLEVVLALERRDLLLDRVPIRPALVPATAPRLLLARRSG